MKQKAFFIIFKGLSVKQITQFFLEGESPTLTYGLLRSHAHEHCHQYWDIGCYSYQGMTHLH